MTGRKLIAIIDGGPGGDHVAEWQRRALASLPAGDSIELVVCTNTKLRRRPWRHALYYALNLVAVRNPLTRQVPLDGLDATITGRTEFASEQDGAWQVLPASIRDRIMQSGAAAVIKLGMGLMRVPPELTLPILSWHHGDPAHFRGRPAGFWELAQRRPVVGQMVQAIGNRLDAGAVLAFAETRVLAHSWRGTLIEAFRHSPLLLGPALDNAQAGHALDHPVTGHNYTLPSNRAVAGLCLRLGAAKLRRVVYGALFEKRWNVSTFPVADAGEAARIVTGEAPLPAAGSWQTAPTPPGYTFLADPFYDGANGVLLVEALAARSGKGELLRIARDGARRISAAPGHHSYPAMVEQDGEWLCVPEIAKWSAPQAFRIASNGLESAGTLEIEGSPRLVDPTFLRRDGRLYLFACDAAEGSNVLRLWHAGGLFERFAQHPASPIRISPRGSRMGGNLIASGSILLRIGQDFTRDYGDGLIVFEIEALSKTAYREHERGALRLADRSGPHTFNLAPDNSQAVIDWYRNAFTPLAGIRRLLARLRP